MIWVYVLFWTVFGGFCFAFALAIQMRIMIGVVVARALRARDGTLGIKASRLAVVRAGNGERDEEPMAHIHATYPEQVQQLRFARNVSVVTPVLIIAILVLWRVFGPSG